MTHGALFNKYVEV